MVSSGESARAHCGQTHGCCSTLTLDSKPVARGAMSANAAKSLANARSPCRGGNRLLWKNDTAANSTEHPGAEAGFWGGTGTAAGESSRTPRRAPAQRREHALLDHLVRPQQYQRRNREAERPRGLRLITNSNFVGCS